MFETKAFAATSAAAPLSALTIPRRDPGATDVRIEILFCGICHSDLHHIRDEMHNIMPTHYPFVPGHEIVGRVTEVGSGASKHKVGDLVGVGCLVDTDRTCPACRDGLEQLCGNMTFSIGSPDPHGTTPRTHGGFSNSIVVDEHFVLRIPQGIDPAAAAPLLCAGITAWAPIRLRGVGPGKKVGIVGLGGLGHMGVKFARALGAHVVAFTTSPEKIKSALDLGAHEVVLSNDSVAMAAHASSFDFILDTVSANHDVNSLLSLLGRDGNLTVVGVGEEMLQVAPMAILIQRRSMSGSNFGSIGETQAMLDFCAEHGIASDIELIAMADVDAALDRLARGDVKYRFVIDMATLAEA